MSIKTAVLMWIKTEGRKVIHGGESGEGTEDTGMNGEGAGGGELSADKNEITQLIKTKTRLRILEFLNSINQFGPPIL